MYRIPGEDQSGEDLPRVNGEGTGIGERKGWYRLRTVGAEYMFSEYKQFISEKVQ